MFRGSCLKLLLIFLIALAYRIELCSGIIQLPLHVGFLSLATHKRFRSIQRSLIINDINFVLEACCREARACTVDSRSSSMRNRLHKVL